MLELGVSSSCQWQNKLDRHFSDYGLGNTQTGVVSNSLSILKSLYDIKSVFQIFFPDYLDQPFFFRRNYQRWGTLLEHTKRARRKERHNLIGFSNIYRSSRKARFTNFMVKNPCCYGDYTRSSDSTGELVSGLVSTSQSEQM